jgi:hypothetical protein
MQQGRPHSAMLASDYAARRYHPAPKGIRNPLLPAKGAYRSDNAHTQGTAGDRLKYAGLPQMAMQVGEIGVKIAKKVAIKWNMQPSLCIM